MNTKLRTVSAMTARKNWGRIMDEVVITKEPQLVERAGRPQVVIVSYEQFQKIDNRITPRERFFQMVHELHDKNKSVNQKEIETDIAEAVQFVRKNK